MTTTDRRDATDAQFEARISRIEAAPDAPESWAKAPLLLKFCDVAGFTPFLERVAEWLAKFARTAR